MLTIGRLLATLGHKLWTLVGPVLLNVVIMKIHEWHEAMKRRREIRAKVRAEREATRSAKTAKEREDAADANHRF